MRCLFLALIVGVTAARSEDWKKVAFIGNAEVKSISGVVEVLNGKEERILREKEKAKVGQTLRIWRGSEVILMMRLRVVHHQNHCGFGAGRK